MAREHAGEMESALSNAGGKLKKIEDEYRRRMEEEIDKNRTLVAQLNQVNQEMDKKGLLILFINEFVSSFFHLFIHAHSFTRSTSMYLTFHRVHSHFVRRGPSKSPRGGTGATQN